MFTLKIYKVVLKPLTQKVAKSMTSMWQRFFWFSCFFLCDDAMDNMCHRQRPRKKTTITSRQKERPTWFRQPGLYSQPIRAQAREPGPPPDWSGLWLRAPLRQSDPQNSQALRPGSAYAAVTVKQMSWLKKAQKFRRDKKF